MELTSVCSHVSFEQAGSVECLSTNLAGKKVSFTSRRSLFRRCNNSRVHQITGAAVA